MASIQFQLTFKRGAHTVAKVVGYPKDIAQLTVGDVQEHVIETEQFLERLTGFRVHIEQRFPDQEPTEQQV